MESAPHLNYVIVNDVRIFMRIYLCFVSNNKDTQLLIYRNGYCNEIHINILVMSHLDKNYNNYFYSSLHDKNNLRYSYILLFVICTVTQGRKLNHHHLQLIIVN